MVRIELCGGALDGAIEALRSNKDDGGATSPGSMFLAFWRQILG